MAALSLLIADRYGLSVWKSSVEACWPPLTPEHGFPSLSYKAQGAPPQPAAGTAVPGITSFSLISNKKQGASEYDAP